MTTMTASQTSLVACVPTLFRSHLWVARHFDGFVFALLIFLKSFGLYMKWKPWMHLLGHFH